MMKRRMTILALSLLAGACDSSSSSKKAPVPAPLDPIVGGPTGDVSGNPNSGGGGAGLPSENPSGTAGSAEAGGTASGLNLRLGLSTTKSQLLVSVAKDFSAKATAFRDASASLRAQTAAFCASQSPENLTLAQESWKTAMSLWQHMELFQIGPLEENVKVLKVGIYAFPDSANLCKIDEEAMKAAASPDSYRLPPQPNRKGFQALEYLLFENSLGSACATALPQTALAKSVNEKWNAQTAEQKWAARCAYLQPVSAELEANSSDLLNRWGSSADNVISRQIGNPAAEQVQIQALYNNLFYSDIELKNSKLAAPAGHDVDYCANFPNPCPGKEEFRFAPFNREAMDINLRAFTDLMFGPADPERRGGFTALIRNEGRADVADKSEAIVSRLAALTLEENGRPLNELIGKQAGEDCNLSASSYLCRMRVSLKEIASELKYEYSKILNLKVPEGPAGDND